MEREEDKEKLIERGIKGEGEREKPRYITKL